LDNLTPYARQYIKVLQRPELDAVTGLPPTVAIQQQKGLVGRRSTVATLTEIYHFLRLLYSKLGRQHCPGCNRRLTIPTRAHIADLIHQLYRRRKATILAPKVTGRKGYHKDLLARSLRKGFEEARIDGKITQ
jgi:excinuclease ABC subunit A